MKLVEEIPLANGLKVEVWDESRPIAADTTKVELLIRSKIELKSSYFTKPEQFELVSKVLGPEIFYEYKKERPFVSNNKKDLVFQELLDNFKKDSLPYLSKPIFPRNFALSKYWDIERNRYKYRSYFNEKPS
ncbi:MAG TPA: hypothetical protein VEF33_01165 [Syntrophales bacterium]|nr:hypothetical protein [Syntrophales bacterium]